MRPKRPSAETMKRIQKCPTSAIRRLAVRRWAAAAANGAVGIEHTAAKHSMEGMEQASAAPATQSTALLPLQQQLALPASTQERPVPFLQEQSRRQPPSAAAAKADERTKSQLSSPKRSRYWRFPFFCGDNFTRLLTTRQAPPRLPCPAQTSVPEQRCRRRATRPPAALSAPQYAAA